MEAQLSYPRCDKRTDTPQSIFENVFRVTVFFHRRAWYSEPKDTQFLIQSIDVCGFLPNHTV